MSSFGELGTLIGIQLGLEFPHTYIRTIYNKHTFTQIHTDAKKKIDEYQKGDIFLYVKIHYLFLLIANRIQDMIHA